ncbi:hypothetical protein AKJ16_DCAP10743 [Drosera capensis]
MEAEVKGWETAARAWLSSLPGGQAVTLSDVENWVSSNQSSLPEELTQSDLLARFTALQASLNTPPPQQERQVPRGENPARFQRSDQWLPVYSWLESLDTDDVISSKDVADWLSSNPDISEKLGSKHTRYHLMHYIKKCHIKILKKQGKFKGELQTHIDTPARFQKVEFGNTPSPLQAICYNNDPKDGDLYQAKRNEALLKYEILVELEKQLSAMVPKS